MAIAKGTAQYNSVKKKDISTQVLKNLFFGIILNFSNIYIKKLGKKRGTQRMYLEMAVCMTAL